MKTFAVGGISIYQNFIYTFLKNVFGINPTCRFYPTCSNYAKESIQKKGVVVGGKMAIIRLLKCQPFYKGN